MIGREFPQLRVACVDVSQQDLVSRDTSVRSRLVEALAWKDGGSDVVETAYRRGQRYQKGLARVELPRLVPQELPRAPGEST